MMKFSVVWKILSHNPSVTQQTDEDVDQTWNTTLCVWFFTILFFANFFLFRKEWRRRHEVIRWSVGSLGRKANRCSRQVVSVTRYVFASVRLKYCCANWSCSNVNCFLIIFLLDWLVCGSFVSHFHKVTKVSNLIKVTWQSSVSTLATCVPFNQGWFDLPFFCSSWRPIDTWKTCVCQISCKRS